MPVRIQRKRSKGWRMPAGAVYVGRPGKWGNPFTAPKGVLVTREMREQPLAQTGRGGRCVAGELRGNNV